MVHLHMKSADQERRMCLRKYSIKDGWMVQRILLWIYIGYRKNRAPLVAYKYLAYISLHTHIYIHIHIYIYNTYIQMYSMYAGCSTGTPASQAHMPPPPPTCCCKIRRGVGWVSASLAGATAQEPYASIRENIICTIVYLSGNHHICIYAYLSSTGALKNRSPTRQPV